MQTSKTNFIELYSKSQKKIFFYILSLVHHRSDAEDLLQQTASEMWRLFDKYQEDKNFAAWGIAIAHYKILDYRKSQSRNKLFLSNDVYEQILDEFNDLSELEEQRRNALDGCLKKLSDEDQKMIWMHYEEGLSYKKVAENLQRSKSGIYKVMARIHCNLLACIKKTLIVWQRNG
ncbi:sigma-70 family RNA polymerase sigma factor [Sedimentisphaera salicampi]|uniref:Sigma-K factor n=1 Tax=Sedimentisphaera salicampi TaxID=1941349 RepID=A0A1W6LJ84_9BACT|nr:sigma-70 family RNA polymerase sigma factor [Sedimentisphaera salicampi]ARN55841.1 Sigma-K factor [Sedimentisphaera salicampi]OXU16032.1 Sigma-K factor [Sedimentisphaera salicampi]